jgi:hypothetical protein
MFALTEPHMELLPAEPYAGNEIDCSFKQESPTVWLGTAKCKHGQARTTTQLFAPGIPSLNPAQMVVGAYRQHRLMIGCDCTDAPPRLNATTTYAPSAGVTPGERRILAETGANIQGYAKKNFSYYGRLTCLMTGSYFIDAKVQLASSVASGARGQGQVFVAGTPPMLIAGLADVAGKATALPVGIVNLYPNQPLAVAYLNSGATNQDVQLVTFTVSEVWIP